MLIYALKSAIVLSFLYLPYLLMLRRESFFHFNRIVLCSILACSLLLPMFNLPLLSLDNNPVVNAAQQQMIDVGIPIAQSAATGSAVQLDELPQTSWWGVVATLYIIVALVLLALRLHDYIRLQRIIRTDCLWQRSADGVTVYCHRGEVPPFSWYRSIVLSQADYEQNGACIIRHEQGHIRAGHSWDIMLLTVVQLVQWFNPLVWVLGQSLQDVHEYEADDYVLRGGITLDEYRYLLIQKAVGTSSYVFTNSFNHSLLKKRIAMMCQKKSSPWRRAKALYILPVAVLALCFFATPEFAKAGDIIVRAIDQKVCYIVDGKVASEDEFKQLQLEDIHDVSVIKDVQLLQSLVPAGEGYTSAVIINTTRMGDVDEQASFPGGTEELNKWVSMHIRYPSLAQEWGQAGCIMVSFVVEADGSITNVAGSDEQDNMTADEPASITAYIRNSGESKDSARNASPPEAESELTLARQQLVAEAERVVRMMPKWTPAQKDGQPVRSTMSLPLTFRLN